MVQINFRSSDSVGSIILPDVKSKPQPLILKLRCESGKEAEGMRQVIIETLREFRYKRENWSFRIEENKGKK